MNVLATAATNSALKKAFRPTLVVRSLATASRLEQLGIAQKWGISDPRIVYHNLSYPEIALHEAHYKEGHFVSNGTFAVDTGIFTGRSPKDKWVVRNPGTDSEKLVDWNNINQEASPEVWNDLYANSISHMNKAERLYVL
mmetsp:Transcript_8350/g.13067  ORF Transcript_8350/g.13067 Transcript_8350/m.13067 type:complete len:140 (-) Transcript_8350:1611-2030(-)